MGLFGTGGRTSSGRFKKGSKAAKRAGRKGGRRSPTRSKSAELERIARQLQRTAHELASEGKPGDVDYISKADAAAELRDAASRLKGLA